MLTRFTAKFILLTLIAFLVLANVQPAAAQRPADRAEMEAFFDSYLAKQMNANHIPGAVVSVVKDGQVVFSKGYGYADLEKKIPFDPDKTILTTASLGKAFTAVGVLQLAERGQIDLHEDTRPYFKAFQLKTRFDAPLTFAHLLTHTDGFETRMIGVGAFSEQDLRPLGELLAEYPSTQIYPPGQYLTYGNYAANLAGYLTQVISGQPFEQYMATQIFTPLGMANSTFDQHLSQSMRDNLEVGYEYQDGKYQPTPFVYVSLAPQGGLRATASDINRFMLALLNGGEYQGGRILKPETVQLMFTRQFSSEPGTPGISYGLFEEAYNGQRIFLRDGDGIGTRTRMILLPDQQTGIFISYNSGSNLLRMDLAHAYLDHYFPQAATAPQPLTGYQERASQFAGTYRPIQADLTTFGKSMFFFSQLVEITVTEQGYLRLEPTGMGEKSSVLGGFEGITDWVEVAPGHFQRVDGVGQISFVQQGETLHLISGQGYRSTFERVAWYEGQSFQIILLELAALILFSLGLATFILWPLGALIGKLRQKPAEKQTWLAIAARLWGSLLPLWLSLNIFRVVGELYAINAVAGMPNFVWGINPGIIESLNGVYLPAALCLSLPVLVALAWRNAWWNLGVRLHYTLGTLAACAVLWWAYYWNLIGFHI
jgi:CubicO group peptidase (beta-lactamase class C family)